MSGARPEVPEANRRRWAARAAESLTPRPVVVEGSLVAQAKAERGTGKPLAVESLEEKLGRLVPGAYLIDTGVVGSVVRYEVRQAGQFTTRVIANGASAREAADRAIFLWSER